MAVIMGAFSIGQAGPSMQAFAAGRAAAFKIFGVRRKKKKKKQEEKMKEYRMIVSFTL